MTNAQPLALVTGASRGIGCELAKQFARNGFDVVVNAEDAAIEQAAALVRAEGALMAGETKVVAASLAVKAQGVVTTVLPDSVKAMGNRVMAEPRD